ncbi:MAG: hypothetical protein DHS20C03_14950 [Minwuia thermotolerans]|nr:MAG: hypothetical protein DHS20C03_14950 [Minwuia thermotolerans]
MNVIRITTAGLLMLVLAACSGIHSNETYKRGELGRAASIEKGTIVSVRNVEVEGTRSGTGTVGGAVAGGAIGSQVGGSGVVRVASAVGGAIIGAVAGSVAEEGITSGTATEFIIRKANGDTFVIVQNDGEEMKAGQPVLIIYSDKTRIVPDQGQEITTAKPAS